MSIKFQPTNSTFSVELERPVQFSGSLFPYYPEQWIGDDYHTNDFHPGPYASPLLGPWLIQALRVDLGLFDARRLFGLPNAQPTYEEALHSAPRTVHDYDGFSDLQRYGSVTGGILSLLRRRKTPVFSHESDTTHTTYHGFLSDRFVHPNINRLLLEKNEFQPIRLPHLERNVPSLGNGRCWRGARWSKSNSSVWIPVEEWNSGSLSSYVCSKPEYLVSAFSRGIEFDGYTNHPARNWFRYSNFSTGTRVIDDGGMVTCITDFSFRMLNHATSLLPFLWSYPNPVFPFAYSMYDITYRFVTYLTFKGVQPYWEDATYVWYAFAFDTAFDDTVDVRLVSHQSNSDVDDPIWDPLLRHPERFSSDLINVRPEISSEPTAYSYPDNRRFERLLSYPDSSGYHGLGDSFRRFCTDHWDDVRDFAAFAANNCLKEFHNSFNAIEFAKELPELVSFIKNSPSILDDLRHIDFRSVTGISDTLDIFASNYLAYVYGLRSLDEDTNVSIAAILSFFTKVKAALDLDARPLYGKYEYNLPIKFDLLNTDVHLDCRAKMVLRSSPGLALSLIMATDGSGALPTFKRVWDLRRGSFIIDWFTALGQRLEFWDHTIARTMLDVDYYVFSYKLTTPIPSSFCRTFGLVPDGTSLRHFERYRSTFHPVWTGRSKFDPIPPAGPDFLSGASLLWLAK
jgi:hypothetical protein